MRTSLLLVGFLTISFMSLSCGRATCDARVCMLNNTNDTVNYSWSSNFFDQQLLPGETTCLELGEKGRNESFGVIFESDRGSFSFDVEECEETYTID